MVYQTCERYECPKSLNTVVETFPSLQCDIRTCSGVKNAKTLADTCRSCDGYILNRQLKDWEEVDKPI